MKGALVVSTLAFLFHPSWIQAADAENPLVRMKNAAMSRVNAAQQKISAPAVNVSKKSGAAKEIRDKWGVFIGVGKFADPTIVPLRCAFKNASLLTEMFKNVGIGRYAPDHVLAIGNAAATKDAIEKNLTDEWLCKKALPEDLVVIYLCTRFVQSESGHDVMLLANDTKLENAAKDGIPLTELLTTVKRRLQSKRVVALLDLSPIAKSNAAASTATFAGSGLNIEQISQKSGVTILSATSGLQRSQHSSTTPVSSFTQFFSDAMGSSMGTLPLASIAEFVGENVNKEATQVYGKQQTPLFVAAADSPDISDVPLGVKLSSSTPHRGPHFGHNIDQLALRRPELLAPSQGHLRNSTTLIAANFTPNNLSAAPGNVASDSTAKTGADKAVKQAPAKTSLAKEAADDDEDNDDTPPQHVDMAPYMKEMKRQIQSKWTPPKGMQEKRVVSVFSIRRNGTIEQPTIVESSGTEAVDASALEALKAASPLPKLPPGSPQFIQIRYQFDWKVKPSTGSTPPATTPAPTSPPAQ